MERSRWTPTVPVEHAPAGVGRRPLPQARRAHRFFGSQQLENRGDAPLFAQRAEKNAARSPLLRQPAARKSRGRAAFCPAGREERGALTALAAASSSKIEGTRRFLPSGQRKTRRVHRFFGSQQLENRSDAPLFAQRAEKNAARPPLLRQPAAPEVDSGAASGLLSLRGRAPYSPSDSAAAATVMRTTWLAKRASRFAGTSGPFVQ